VLAQDRAERFLRRAVRRPVVVREVEVGDAEVERASRNRTTPLERRGAAEVVPEAERHDGQLQAAAARAAVDHPVVAAHVPIACSRRTSLRLVFRSVDMLRLPMISAQPIWYVPAGNCFGRVPGTTTEFGGT